MAEYEFVNLGESVPGGYRYFVSETKTWFRNYLNIYDLRSAIRQHYRANQLECPANIDDLIADQLCPELPPERCTRLVSGKALPYIRGGMTVTDVVNGTKNLLSWQWAGRPRVSMDEANRRAEICSRCQYNQQATGCHTCNSPLKKMVDAFVNGGTTKFESYLRSCRVCKCSLRSKVWFPLDILVEHMPQEQEEALPEFCWLKEHK